MRHLLHKRNSQVALLIYGNEIQEVKEAEADLLCPAVA